MNSITTIYILVLLLSAVASFITRVSGFGFGIFVMIFFPYILPTYGESIMLSGLLAGTTALIIAVRNFHHISWRNIWYILFFNVIASFIAIEFVSTMSNAALKRCLGVVMVITAIYFMLYEGRIKGVFSSRKAQMVIGCISGVTGGMFAMPGPPIVLYCVSALKDKMQYIATLQAFSVLLNIFYTTFRARVGFFSDEIINYWLIGVIGICIGSGIGSVLFKRINGNTQKRIVYFMMIASGIIAILQI